jgi:hypothetical protein
MRPKPARSLMFAIALPVLLFIAGISATCGVSKGETRDWQEAPAGPTTVSISSVRP